MSAGEQHTGSPRALRGSAFALVLTDMRMFAEDGIELVRHVADRYPNTYSMVVTGLALPEIEDQLRRAGAFSVLAKPIDRDQLGAAVDQVMTNREHTVSLRGHQSA